MTGKGSLLPAMPSSHVAIEMQRTGGKQTRTILPYTSSKWSDIYWRATTYRMWFVLCLLINLGLALPSMAGVFSWGKINAPSAAITNILITLCIRSEALLRMLHWAEVQLFRWRWIPLFIKHCVVSMQLNIGGIHSGCAVSSLIWIVYVVVLSFIGTFPGTRQAAVITLSMLILFLISAACVGAIPRLRNAHHEAFENMHRYSGWTALAVLWAFVIVGNAYEPDSRSYHIAAAFWKKYQLWVTIGATILIVLPWLGVRKVPVQVETPGKGVVLLHFEGGIGWGLLGRISRKPLWEWHAFGISSEGRQSGKHMMIIAILGGFTKSLAEDKPSHIYVRKFKFAGVGYLTCLYSRVVMVATGSGLGPMLSLYLQSRFDDAVLIWVGRGLQENYGSQVWSLVHDAVAADRLITVDTLKQDKPDIVSLACNAAWDIDAQAVFINSNPKGAEITLRGCAANGIQAFRPAWDS